MFARCLETTECRRCFSYLEHLLDFLPRQVDVELVEELEDLADAQTAVAVLVGLGEGLFQPRDDAERSRKASATSRDTSDTLEGPRGSTGVRR